MISHIITLIQVILAIVLIGAILLQQKGTGLGAAFGGSGAVYTTRRGIDKILYNITIVVSILFFLVAFINLFV